jgi:hypothetical protein
MAAMLSITDLLRDAADALQEAYKDRDDVPPATLALIVELRERADRQIAASAKPDEPEPEAPTITQDEP